MYSVLLKENVTIVFVVFRPYLGRGSEYNRADSNRPSITFKKSSLSNQQDKKTKAL